MLVVVQQTAKELMANRMYLEEYMVLEVVKVCNMVASMPVPGHIFMLFLRRSKRIHFDQKLLFRLCVGL